MPNTFNHHSGQFCNGIISGEKSSGPNLFLCLAIYGLVCYFLGMILPQVNFLTDKCLGRSFLKLGSGIDKRLFSSCFR